MEAALRESHNGGGSGGSIWISANILSGSSSVTANGGNGYGSTGGAGGGGRIAIYAASGTHDGSRSVTGGTGFQSEGRAQ